MNPPLPEVLASDRHQGGSGSQPCRPVDTCALLGASPTARRKKGEESAAALELAATKTHGACPPLPGTAWLVHGRKGTLHRSAMPGMPVRPRCRGGGADVTLPAEGRPSGVPARQGMRHVPEKNDAHREEEVVQLRLEIMKPTWPSLLPALQHGLAPCCLWPSTGDPPPLFFFCHPDMPACKHCYCGFLSCCSAATTPIQSADCCLGM